MSWPLTGDDLAALRSVDVAAMPSTCRRGRRTKAVTDGRVNYGTTVTWGSTFSCRVNDGADPLEEQEQVGRSGWELETVIACPLGTDVAAGDWVEAVTTPIPAGASATQVWEVVGEPLRRTYMTSLRVRARRVG